MKVKNYLANKDDLKTKLQWQNVGKTPIDESLGVEYWNNRFCQVSAVYFESNNVRDMTAAEIEEFKELQREQHREAYEKRRKIKLESTEEARRLKQMDLEFDKRKSIPGIVSNHAYSTIVVEINTTGISLVEEILEICILDNQGKVILDTLVRPEFHDYWPEAQAVNHISPADVENAPQMRELFPTIKGIIEASDTLISYSTAFLKNYLSLNCGIRFDTNMNIIDVMMKYADVVGEYDDYWQENRYQKRSKCLKHYGYTLRSHNAKGLAEGTLHCYNKMNFNR